MLEILTCNDILKWEAYLKKATNYDIYFTPQYFELARRNNEGTPYCAVLNVKSALIIYPFLVNRINNGKLFDIQSCYGYGGMLYNELGVEFIDLFLVEFKKWCESKNIVAEFIRFHPILNNHKLVQEKIKILPNRTTVFLDLSKSEDELWNGLSSKCRNMIRKAKKKGFTVNNPLFSNCIDKFYELYQSTMTKVKADEYYFFSKEYFKNMSDLFEDSLQFYSVDFEEKMVAAAIFFSCNGLINYHLSARDNTYSKDGLMNLIIDHVIKENIDNGNYALNLGGGNINDPRDSLFKFKSSFSNDTRIFYIGAVVHNQLEYNKLIEDWNIKFPEKSVIMNNIFLRYRF